jgi:hypothetical protein
MTGRLHAVSQSEKQFLEDAVFAAERAKGKKLSGPVKKEVLRVAREQLLGQREAEAAKQARAEELQAAEFAWSKPKPFRR